MPTFGRDAPAIYVSNVERSATFFCDVLGFKITFTNGNSRCVAIVAQANAELHLTLNTAHAGTSHAHLMIKGLEEIYETLVNSEATIRQPPKVQEWDLRDIVFQDSDGNTFENAQTVRSNRIVERTRVEPIKSN